MATEEKDYGTIDAETLKAQVDALTDDAKALVATRLAELAKAKEPPPDFGAMSEGEWRKFTSTIR